MPFRARFSLSFCGALWTVVAALSSVAAQAGQFDPFAWDPFGEFRGLPTSPHPNVGNSVGTSRDAPSCEFGPLSAPLDLAEAVDRALCANPKTRGAWASLRADAAGVGVARAAFLPTANAQWQDQRQHHSSDVKEEPSLGSESKATVRSRDLSLNWVLYDFGARSASLDSARQTLAAAQASLSLSQQQVLQQTAKDFYAVQAAQASLSTTLEIERLAGESLATASVRVERGVAPVSDRYQAQTAYAQAQLNRAKAAGDLVSAQGALAIDMSLDPQNAPTLLDLPDIEALAQDSAGYGESLRALLEAAQRAHPSIVVAQAQLAAQEAKTRAVRDQGLPTVSLVARESHNDQPVSPSVGAAPLAAHGREAYVGVQVSVPLFEGFGRNYQTLKEKEQIAVQRAALTDAQLQVAQGVWSAYQGVATQTENLTQSASVLRASSESFEAAQVRYRGGAGAMLELLTAQSTLANAQQQRIRAIADWKSARVELAARLGRLTPERLGQTVGEAEGGSANNAASKAGAGSAALPSSTSPP